MAEHHNHTMSQVRMEKIRCPDRRKEQKTILSSFERRQQPDRRKSVRFFIVKRNVMVPADPVVKTG